jgi:hypothetical protein
MTPTPFTHKENVMRHLRHVAAIALLVMTWNVTTRAQEPAAAPAQATLTPAQMEGFLLRAKIGRMRDAGDGITGSRRATMSDGALTHDAHIQVINQTTALFRPPTGPPEMNFRDFHGFNVAAYRLAVLLELDNVPMSVERTVDGKRAAVTWWIDDVLMDERTRLKKEERSPDPERLAMQTHVMRVFDELIANRDRNMGNLLWTTDWKMWMIDHTRAFRLGTDLQRPATLVRIERSLFENMRKLTPEAVTTAVGGSLSRYEIQAMLARRDGIVKLFETKIAERGEAPILYALPR